MSAKEFDLPEWTEQAEFSSEMRIGLDVGSTTVKAVVLDDSDTVIFQKYIRHFSEVRESAAAILREIAAKFSNVSCRISVTGSGAISLAKELAVPFVQEVISSGLGIQKQIPDADVVIELGGEDAKLTFFTGGLDQRMNETCAGGTGAFIDQMAAFIRTDAAGLDNLARRHGTIYPIASRCGVFSKTDVLPLLNEGAAQEDIAASIMQAVVNQTVSGLARGRAIKGKVVFLGGPLAFLHSLRDRFKATLKDMTEAVFPENAQYFVAYGAALHARSGEMRPAGLHDMIARLEGPGESGVTTQLPRLFDCPEERKDFFRRHEVKQAPQRTLADCPDEAGEARGEAWLGFDCGSTTLKAVLLDAGGNILYSYYGPNMGDPLAAALAILKDIHAR